MSDEILANDLSWALNDLIVDLASAVSMGREVLAEDRSHPDMAAKLCGRLRVCNHSIVISLFKLDELSSHYFDFIKKLPAPLLEDFYNCLKMLRVLKVGDLRNAHVAHPIDKKTKAPITVEKLEHLMALMTGKDNLDAERLYSLICPEKPRGKKCLVNTLHDVIEFCRDITKDKIGRR
ncbi:hypothetical protein C4E44_00575 [Pseudomonas sp. MWU12-2312b]|nr:hypothetical protein C4E44_00575 [Pseudomonas sp. MWU12-2312b]